MLDANILREFLQHSKCKLYFSPDPFLRGGDSISINSIEDTLLMNMIDEFNQAGSDDSKDIVL